MIRWTTPTITCQIEPADIECDFVVVTFKTGNTLINKKVYANEMQEGSFDLVFTQEETALLQTDKAIQVQANLMKGDVRLASMMKTFKAFENLFDWEMYNE